MFILSLLSVVVLDQLSKAAAQQWLDVVFNPGISFNWLVGVPQMGLMVLVGVMALGIGWYLWRRRQAYPLWAGLFVGGMLSNGLDRLLLGGVRDWFTIPGTQIMNNFADVAISIGMIGIVWTIVRTDNNV